MRRFSLLILSLLLTLVLVVPAFAQEPVVLSLQTAVTALQTGQEYEIEIRVDGVENLWIAEVEIAYDPTLVYIMGTKSGSPIQPGDFFTADRSVVIRNSVATNQLVYTVSLLGEVDPINGSGAVGRFRIYPLAAGATRLTFRQAELRQIVGGNATEAVQFTPVLLDLTITGNPVEPPSEATATPRPTDTPEAAIDIEVATEEPTLVNVTAAPRTPTPTEIPAVVETDSASPLLPIAIGVAIFGGLGLVIVLVMWRRSGRR